MEQKFCQSCGMPMHNEELLGIEKDGSKNSEYCLYCYKNGEFTVPEATLDQMIEICIPHMIKQGLTEDNARKTLNQFLPGLKRWQK